MKRGRFDSDYDRVREEAGFVRTRTEFPETVDSQGRTAEQRVEEMRIDFHERVNLARAAEQEAERAAGVSKRHDAFRADVDRAIMISEYESLGLTPPTPLCSLGLLLSIGWTIAQFGETKVLMRPEKHDGPRKRREDYEQTEGT